MSGAWLLARRNLVGSRVRFVASVGGVAMALTLTLALDAIFAGVADQLTTYIDRAGADVWVSQEGVRNLHMVASSLPASTTAAVEGADGVAAVTPILEATDTIAVGDERTVVYVIGLPTGAAMGGPWDVEGSRMPRPGEVVVDAGFARTAGVAIGGSVIVQGRETRIVGLSHGTASLVNSVAFVSSNDFQAMRGGLPSVSFVLAKVKDGASPSNVAEELERAIPGVTAQTTAAFASEERRLVLDMSGDVIGIMSAVGFGVALTVLALTVYVATFTRRREYGALKALGASNRFLYGVVTAQAFLSVAVGLAVSLGFTAGLALVITRTGMNLEMAITVTSFAKVGAFAVVIAGLSAILPIRGIASLDPADVFRRGAAL